MSHNEEIAERNAQDSPGAVMLNRLTSSFIMVLGAIWAGSSLVHGYILGVVADRPESDGAFQGAEQTTLLALEVVGVMGGLALMAIGLVGLMLRRDPRHGDTARVEAVSAPAQTST